MEDSLRRLRTDWIDLYRIDEIVPPGTDLYQANVWRPPVLSDPLARRRPVPDRAAA